MKRVESGMTFLLDEGRTLLIEDFVLRAFGAEFRRVEFAAVHRRRDGTELLRIVEAKATFPNPASQDTSDDFHRGARELAEKFPNSLALIATTLLARHDPAGLIPEGLDREAIARMEWFLVLVVRGHAPQHAVELRDALARKMRPLRDAFALPDGFLHVLTEQQARQRQMIE